ncbi:unnamed protein product, partial [Rotaria sp. Silwood1]
EIRIRILKQAIKTRAINESTSVPQIQNEKASRTDLSTLPITALHIRYDNDDATRNELLEGLSFVVAKISDKKIDAIILREVTFTQNARYNLYLLFIYLIKFVRTS